MHRYQRHIDKAESMGGARLVTDVHTHTDYLEFFVTGSTGNSYSVFYDDRKGWMCRCAAGESGRCCYHIGAAYLRKVADSIVMEPVNIPTPAACPECGTVVNANGRCLNAVLGFCDFLGKVAA
jgi:hypothetical protein